MGLERSPNNVRFIPNLNINVENLPCISFWKSLCVHKIGPTYACRKLRVHSKGFLWPYFSKTDLFVH